MYVNTDIVASTRGAVTDASTLRMEELYGCWQEARRCDKVATRLLLLRSKNEVDDYYDDITILLREVESSSRLLRDLYDLFAIYRSRIPYIHYYLTIILPSMSKTMRDMLVFIDNEQLPTRLQWTLMGEKWIESSELGLSNRFQMYCDALIQLIRLLGRCGGGFFLLLFFSSKSFFSCMSYLGH